MSGPWWTANRVRLITLKRLQRDENTLFFVILKRFAVHCGHETHHLGAW